MCILPLQENVPLIQEVDQLNYGVDDVEAGRMNDALSFKMEELVHKEHEAHEMKEPQAENIIEEIKTAEITTAEFFAIEQVNNLTWKFIIVPKPWSIGYGY